MIMFVFRSLSGIYFEITVYTAIDIQDFEVH